MSDTGIGERDGLERDRSVARPPRRRSAGGTLLIVLVSALVGGLIFSGGFLVASRMQPTQQSVVTPASPPDVGDRDNQIETAAATVVPSVVNVAVDSATFSGIGSGIIIRSDGYILTNNHVVEGATSVTVRLGASNVRATVVGTDPTTDIAVIHIAKTGLPVAKMAIPTSLAVGQAVIAIGSPFGLDKTVTSGIISALHRSDIQSGASGGLTSYTNLIQTDAAINPGNSGGALADLGGEVVGMNTLIQSPSGQLGVAQSAGIGFAIPIDFALPLANDLIAGKKVTHPYLGVGTVTITPGIAQLYGLGSPTGALVQSVDPASPAASAGIRVGDIIVKFGGATITSSEDLFSAIQSAKVGAPVSVVVVRNTRTVTLSATLVAQ